MEIPVKINVTILPEERGARSAILSSPFQPMTTNHATR
jgi:hypothetical protein